MADSAAYAEWIVANRDKQGTPEFDTVAEAYKQAKQLESQAAPSPISTTPEQKQEAVANRVSEMEKRDAVKAEAEQARLDAEQRWNRFNAWQNSAGPMERLGLIAKAIGPSAAKRAAEVGVAGTGQMGGQVIGRTLGGNIGASIGGGIGGALGSLAEQSIGMQYGDESFKPGKLIADVVSGMTTTPGAKINAVSNAAAETIRSLIDERQMPSAANVALAAGAGYAAGKLSTALAGKKMTPYDALFEYRNNAFRALRDEGVVINPALMNRGNRAITMLAGDTATNVAASRQNQSIWQKLSREELGLNKSPAPFRRDVVNEFGVVVKPGEITELIKKNGVPYENIRALSEDAAAELGKGGEAAAAFAKGKTQEDIKAILGARQDLLELRKTRDQIRDLGVQAKQGVAGAFDSLQVQRKLEDEIEGRIEMAAKASGKPKMLKELIDARTKLAKIYAVREAVDDVSGLVDVNQFANIRATPTKPGRLLTGNLRKMADFAESFGNSALDAVNHASQPQPGVALNYTLRQTAMGNLAGPMSAGVPYLSESARNYLLKESSQNKYAMPRFVINPPNPASMAARIGVSGMGRGYQPIQSVVPKNPNQPVQ
jgi:hypothetical protein